jgi:hypothetical protein
MLENAIIGVLYALAFALLNRARGSRLFDLVDSTTEGRMAAMFFMALLTVIHYMPIAPHAVYMAFLADFVLLYFWCMWRWDAYWSAAIGSDITHSRLWGVLAMTARQGLILPFYAFVSWQSGWVAPWWGLSFLLMGVTYTISSKLSPGVSVIRNAEFANGAIMGLTVWMLGA